jgi:heme/copper-type cytochrome/quinol oxidase subunit 2
VSRPTDEPQPVREEEPKLTPRVSSARREEPAKEERKSRKGLLWTIIIVLAVIILGIIGWTVWSNSKGADTGIDTSKYQAVFMSNGQIYFGKLSAFNDESLKITKVYYPQAQATGTTDEETDNNDQSNIQLFRVTDGVHGPEDQMIIMKDQVLYYENLKSDSKVTQLIEQNEAQ